MIATVAGLLAVGVLAALLTVAFHGGGIVDCPGCGEGPWSTDRSVWTCLGCGVVLNRADRVWRFKLGTRWWRLPGFRGDVPAKALPLAVKYKLKVESTGVSGPSAGVGLGAEMFGDLHSYKHAGGVRLVE